MWHSKEQLKTRKSGRNWKVLEFIHLLLSRCRLLEESRTPGLLRSASWSSTIFQYQVHGSVCTPIFSLSWLLQERTHNTRSTMICQANLKKLPPQQTTTILRPFFRDHLGEPAPEENFWNLWCKGRLTEADTPTTWRRHSIRTKPCPPPPPPFITGRMPFLPPNQQCQSTEGT